MTHDLSDITSNELLTSVGKKVRATVRFSTVGGESGSADTARDPRGFAIKLRTEQGNWDWVFVCPFDYHLKLSLIDIDVEQYSSLLYQRSRQVPPFHSHPEA